MGDMTVGVPAETRTVVHCDIDGDLRLDVGENQTAQSFIVCSKTLSRASKVFKAMLNGGFRESKPANSGQEWVVALPEDNSKSLATLLYIIHSMFNEVPDTVTRDELFQITVLTDKYSMTEVVRPWVQAWIKPLASGSRPRGQKGDAVLLWIAWEVGHLELFKTTLSHLQETCTIDEDGRVLDSHGFRLEENDHIKFLGVTDGTFGLAETRIARLQLLFQCINCQIEELASVHSKRIDHCHTYMFSRIQTESCKTWYLGSLIRSLAKEGRYPMPLPVGISDSVQKVRAWLAAVCDGIKSTADHKICSPGFKLKQSIATVQEVSTVTSAQMEHIQRQAVKTGL